MKKKGKGSGFWNIADSLEGDKVIWMIVLLGAILVVAIVIAVAIIKKKKPELPDGK